MPYKIVKVSKGYKVSGPEGTKYSKKPQSLGRARAQLRALYANEGGMGQHSEGHSAESTHRGG